MYVCVYLVSGHIVCIHMCWLYRVWYSNISGPFIGSPSAVFILSHWVLIHHSALFQQETCCWGFLQHIADKYTPTVCCGSITHSVRLLRDWLYWHHRCVACQSQSSSVHSSIQMQYVHVSVASIFQIYIFLPIRSIDRNGNDCCDHTDGLTVTTTCWRPVGWKFHLDLKL